MLAGNSSPEAAATASPPVDYEFRYILAEATEATLVWGINGWQAVDLAGLPAGTQVVDGVMHTPMAKEGNAFVTRIAFPPGTTVDYGFLAGNAPGEAEMVWDGEQEDHFITSEKSSFIEVYSTLELPASQGAGGEVEPSLVTQEFYYRMPYAGEVSLVWGMNGWNVAPEELRPPGTVVTDNLMHTPMLREGDVFTAKIQIPPSAIQYYKTRPGIVIQESVGFPIATPVIMSTCQEQGWCGEGNWKYIYIEGESVMLPQTIQKHMISNCYCGTDDLAEFSE